MCTALTLTSKDGFHFFGRNLDLQTSFNQSIILVPRKFYWRNIVSGKHYITKYAIIGMATFFNNNPYFADGFNESGLACATLALRDYAEYEESSISQKINLGPYDLVLWILSNFKTVSEVKSALKEVNLVNKPVAPDIPITPLHWIVYDINDECIVIEKTADKFAVYDNKVGVLTNSPTFDWQIANLNYYTKLLPNRPEEITWYKQNLKPVGEGSGLLGMPGDFYPPSRFVRAAFFKNYATFLDTKDSTISEFFHILNNVAFIGGSVLTETGKALITLYTTCICLESKVYYYTTYNNSQINAINMSNEDLDAKKIKVFEYKDTQSINFQN